MGIISQAAGGESFIFTGEEGRGGVLPLAPLHRRGKHGCRFIKSADSGRRCTGQCPIQVIMAQSGVQKDLSADPVVNLDITLVSIPLFQVKR